MVSGAIVSAAQRLTFTRKKRFGGLAVRSVITISVPVATWAGATSSQITRSLLRCRVYVIPGVVENCTMVSPPLNVGADTAVSTFAESGVGRVSRPYAIAV